jgi:hypothetical protein
MSSEGHSEPHGGASTIRLCRMSRDSRRLHLTHSRVAFEHALQHACPGAFSSSIIFLVTARRVACADPTHICIPLFGLAPDPWLSSIVSCSLFDSCTPMAHFRPSSDKNTDPCSRLAQYTQDPVLAEDVLRCHSVCGPAIFVSSRRRGSTDPPRRTPCVGSAYACSGSH